MTTRFSLSELAEMLHVPVDAVRQAVDALAPEFTGESFIYNERTWAIAPSDVLRIQTWIESHSETSAIGERSRARRVRVKRMEQSEETGE